MGNGKWNLRVQALLQLHLVHNFDYVKGIVTYHAWCRTRKPVIKVYFLVLVSEKD